jgi:hypothetical protein
VLPFVLAAFLITANDDDRRNVEPAGSHELAWCGLVARREAHHAVEQRALDLDLDIGRDEVARRQNVSAAPARARDEVARRRRAHLER